MWPVERIARVNRGSANVLIRSASRMLQLSCFNGLAFNGKITSNTENITPREKHKINIVIAIGNPPN